MIKRLCDQGLVSLGNFVIGVVVARFLGSEQFGVFALLWTIIIFALNGTWALVAAPMQGMIAKRTAQQRDELLATMALITVAIGAVGGLVGLAVVAGTSSVSPVGAVVYALAALSIVLQDFARRWFLATERPGYALASDGMRYLLALFALFLLAHGTLVAAVGAVGAAAFVGSSLLATDVVNGDHRWRIQRQIVNEQLEVGMWLIPSVALQSLATAIPLYGIGIRVGIAAAGGYRAVYTLLSPIVSFTEALETFLPLRGSQAMVEGGSVMLRRVLWRWWWPSQLLCLFYVVAIFLAGPRLLGVVFGPAYVPYGSLVWPLAIALLLQFASYFCHVALRALGQTRVIPYADIVATCVLGALFLVTPLRHLWWAAALVAISQAIKVAIWGYFARTVMPSRSDRALA